MRIKQKVTILLLLFLIVLSFSGCSIKRVEEGVENKSPEEERQEETKNIDSDGDGLLDEEEEKIGTNKENPDTDSDNLSDFFEISKWKTDPLNSDTDGDGYLDGQEVENGYNPVGPGQLDSDNDGLGNADEKNMGTDPEKFDTDGDGLSDKEEIDSGRDPLKEG